MTQPDTVALVLDPAGTDIQAELAEIVARGPVTRVELPGGIPAWAASDTAVLKKLLTDERVSKDAHQHWPPFINGEVGPEWVMYPWIAVSSMLTAYGADHARLRRLVGPAFTQRRIQAVRPGIEAITADLLDKLAATPSGETVDLRADFALPLPIRVITQFMGVPEDLAGPVSHSARTVLDTTLSPQQASDNFVRLYQALGSLLAYKRDHPGDDLTTLLMAASDEDGSRLSEAELGDTLMLIISAGHETTVNLLHQAIHLLLTHPEQAAAVRSGEIPWTAVIEETLRLQPPIIHMPIRFAVDDIEIAGVSIAKGDLILASLGGAGRDSRIHGSTAGRFDPGRGNHDHLAFGYGVHHCVGAPLARLEGAIALPALFDRFPDIGLASEADRLTPVTSFMIDAHTTLPVYLG